MQWTTFCRTLDACRRFFYGLAEIVPIATHQNGQWQDKPWWMASSVQRLRPLSSPVQARKRRRGHILMNHKQAMERSLRKTSGMDPVSESLLFSRKHHDLHCRAAEGHTLVNDRNPTKTGKRCNLLSGVNCLVDLQDASLMPLIIYRQSSKTCAHRENRLNLIAKPP